MEVQTENMSDIQNYLDTFQKEIQTNQHETGAGEVGQVYMDQNGQYFIRQAAEEEPPVAGSSRPKRSGRGAAAATAVSGELAAPAQPAAGAAAGANFQTVTIVPSDGNADEVSYVLIVQPDSEEGQKHEPEDPESIGVYDFDERDEGGPQEEDSGDEDDKRKLTRMLTRKSSQTVTQAHMCSYCNYTTPKRYLLSRHMKSHSEERPHKCSVCERGFKTLASLQNHVNTHTGTKPHCCKFCDANFTTSGELVRHVRYIHTKEKPHTCTECDYSSVELSKLRRHMRSHTGERPYQCPHCTYASPDTFKLKRHLRIHTGEKPYECEICGSRFTQSNSLKAHRQIHSGEKPLYHCELCPTTCGRKTDLRIHVQKLHTSDRPIKCKRCGKSFPDRYSFKLHSKTHEGEKCFRCDLCPYMSTSQRHLESHMLIHTDQKPYVCQHCDQSFRQKQLLKRHVNLYHNPNYIPPQPREKTHECPECGRAFRHKGNLIRHLAIHDPEASAAEKQLALKLGRETKVSLMNESLQYEDEELVGDAGSAESGGEQKVVAVQGQDGQQYVVLEVIQLQDANGEEQTVAVVPDSALSQAAGAGGSGIDMQLAAGPAASSIDAAQLGTDVSLADDGLPADLLPEAAGEGASGEQPRRPTTPGGRRRVDDQAVQKSKQDMQNCFGFDDDDDAEMLEKKGAF
ncbi:transcriptional repressor CTCF-like [Amphibalanus amphitrite]|uniref:transcriptional repressor CTCF-like n=1 Tax=Amphibalanus amphitrite TaxID=1232801 RepID=UPI001C928758|nr:transcriptional repressor CTCF-like [Amphibalanus amphitrite]XP_043218624.1 transcriptional repressor CTCF-like [Amphibalanus amphitrite]XP_043218626.1 transcriptional repressor CTCF-like [Amphibalanus amphitrite]XP_043218627.1 transcriptional repressor CTCF-like [Amphibalanus amphitrite]